MMSIFEKNIWEKEEIIVMRTKGVDLKQCLALF